MYTHRPGQRSCFYQPRQLRVISLTFSYICFSFNFISFNGHLYSASSRNLVRGAPNSSAAKKNGFKTRKKHRWDRPREKTWLQREPIPSRRALQNRKGTVLPGGGTGKRNLQETLLR